MTGTDPAAAERVFLGPNAALVITPLESPSDPDRAVLDLRIWRRFASMALAPTTRALRLAPEFAPAVAQAILRAAHNSLRAE